MTARADDEPPPRLKPVAWCAPFAWPGYRILAGEEDCANISLAGLGSIIPLTHALVPYRGNVHTDPNPSSLLASEIEFLSTYGRQIEP